MNLLLGKNALILGANTITIGIATRYVAEGASVTVVAQSDALADYPAPEGAKSVSVSGNAVEADRQAISAVAGASLDILVLGGDDVPEERDWVAVSALSADVLHNAQDRMVIPALQALQACEAALKAASDASIIFLYSPAGIYSEGGWSSHTVSYHALHGMMRAVASEWGPVRANMLVPFADTPGFRAFRERNPAEVDERISLTAMKRVGDPVNDIGRVAVFMGSDDTHYVTGMMIFADGGAHMIAPAIETKMPLAGKSA